MRNMIIEITEQKLGEAEILMGFTYDEAIEMMALTNDITTDEVERLIEIDRQANIQAYIDAPDDGDAEAEYEFEMRSENAWLTHAEYNPEAQDEMYREDMMGGF